MRAHSLRWLLLLGAFALAACSSDFSAARSKEITPQQFVEIYRLDAKDQMFYVGSYDEYHYFFRARPVGSASLKIRRSAFRLPGEFPLPAHRDPLLLVGHFDTATATWIQKPGF